jgi:hypothetical protein
MKRITILLTVIMIAFGLVSCGIVSRETSKEQSTFKQNFSIGPIVEAHKELLLDSPRTLSGMEAGPPEPFIQYQEEMIVQIDPTNIPAFMEAIKFDVQEAITSSGAEYLGQGGGYSPGSDINPADVTHFSFDYSEDGFYGVIHIWGVRGSGTNYHLIGLITESSGA